MEEICHEADWFEKNCNRSFDSRLFVTVLRWLVRAGRPFAVGRHCSGSAEAALRFSYSLNPYDPAITGLSWYAVRAYYTDGPWSGVVSGWPYHWTGWSDYAAQNGIGCTPGTLVKGGDGIMYACQ